MIALLALLLAAPPPAVESLTRSSLRLMGRFNGAHACPVSPRLAITNAHVLDHQRPFDPALVLLSFAWSDGAGNSGFVAPLSIETARDIGTVEPLRAGDVFPHYLPIAAAAPKPGDRIFFLGYDWRNKKSAFEDEVIDTRVTRVVALHVMFTTAGEPGSSGSCIVNEAGEVLAINEGWYATDDGEKVGFGVGIWGNLKDVPK